MSLGGSLGASELCLAPHTKAIPSGGRQAAQRTLESFLTTRGVDYMREMSSPLTAEDSCSRLSAPLVFGTLSLREVVQAGPVRDQAREFQALSGHNSASRQQPEQQPSNRPTRDPRANEPH